MREGESSAYGSTAGGADGAGLASQINVQTHGEILGLTHIQQDGSAHSPGQRFLDSSRIADSLTSSGALSSTPSARPPATSSGGSSTWEPAFPAIDVEATSVRRYQYAGAGNCVHPSLTSRWSAGADRGNGRGSVSVARWPREI